MGANLLQTAILSAAESFLNGILSLDPVATSALQKLSGKSLRVECELPPMSINLVLSDGSIMLLGSQQHQHADATVRGKGHALLKLLTQDSVANLRDSGVTVSGDTGFLNALQSILKNLDVDWEYRLSKLLGDIPTQALSDAMAGTRKFTSQSANNLRDDIDAWLHEEKKLFPQKNELAMFYQDIDKLRLRADRLEARVRKLGAG